MKTFVYFCRNFQKKGEKPPLTTPKTGNSHYILKVRSWKGESAKGKLPFPLGSGRGLGENRA